MLIEMSRDFRPPEGRSELRALFGEARLVDWQGIFLAGKGRSRYRGCEDTELPWFGPVLII